MIKVKISQFGWLIALVLIGVMVAGGFQGPTLKLGVADLDKVLQSSNYWTSSEGTYNEFTQKRQDLLKLFSQYRSMTSDQIKSLHDLTIKDNPSTQDTAQLTSIKAQVAADDSRQKELSIKQTLTPEERNLLTHYTQQAEANVQSYEQISQEFTQEAAQKRDKILKDGMDKVRLAVQTVGKAQGYTTVLSAAAAPYCANDITDDAIKAMNLQKG